MSVIRKLANLFFVKSKEITEDYVVQSSDASSRLLPDGSNNNVTITFPESTEGFLNKLPVEIDRVDCPIGDNQKELSVSSWSQVGGLATVSTNDPHNLDANLNKNLGIYGSTNNIDTINTQEITVINPTTFTYIVDASLPATGTGTIVVIVSYVVRVIGTNGSLGRNEGIELDDFSSKIKVSALGNNFTTSPSLIERYAGLQMLSTFIHVGGPRNTLITYTAGDTFRTNHPLKFGFLDTYHDTGQRQYREYNLPPTKGIPKPPVNLLNVGLSARGKFYTSINTTFEELRGVEIYNDVSFFFQAQATTTEANAGINIIFGNSGIANQGAMKAVGASLDVANPSTIELSSGLQLKETVGIIRSVGVKFSGNFKIADQLRSTTDIYIPNEIDPHFIVRVSRGAGGTIVGAGFDVNTVVYEDPNNLGTLLAIPNAKYSKSYFYVFFGDFLGQLHATYFENSLNDALNPLVESKQEPPLIENGATGIEIAYQENQTDLIPVGNSLIKDSQRLRE
jgi:hypothetical protein